MLNQITNNLIVREAFGLLSRGSHIERLAIVSVVVWSIHGTFFGKFSESEQKLLFVFLTTTIVYFWVLAENSQNTRQSKKCLSLSLFLCRWDALFSRKLETCISNPNALLGLDNFMEKAYIFILQNVK